MESDWKIPNSNLVSQKSEIKTLDRVPDFKRFFLGEFSNFQPTTMLTNGMRSCRACGAMDNASAYGAEDSRFESWHARFISVACANNLNLKFVLAVACSSRCTQYEGGKIMTWSCIHFSSKNMLHRPGIEPGSPAWQASILPLNHRC